MERGGPLPCISELGRLGRMSYLKGGNQYSAWYTPKFLSAVIFQRILG